MPSKSRGAKLAVATPAPIAGDEAWRWRSYGAVEERIRGLVVTGLESNRGAAPLPNHRFFDDCPSPAVGVVVDPDAT